MKKLKIFLNSIIGGFFSLLVILFFLVMWSAYLKSCFTSVDKNSSSNQQTKLKIVKYSVDNANHRKLIAHSIKIYSAVGMGGGENFDVYFVDEPKSLNAVSFGNNRYLFWETIAGLPDWAIDSILSHEIAHDSLLHSRKMRDAEDLRNFFTEILSLIGGADESTEATLQDWSSKLTIPVYSKSQEYEADEYAVTILSLSGYKQSKLIYVKTLNLIKNKYGDSGGGFFDSHPSTTDRIKNILALEE